LLKSAPLRLWIYDLRTNKHFTFKEPSSSEIDWRSGSPKGQRCSADQNPLKHSDLDDFVNCYLGGKHGSLEDSANLPDPDIIAAEIVEDLEAALSQFAEIASDLKRGASESKAEQA